MLILVYVFFGLFIVFDFSIIMYIGLRVRNNICDKKYFNFLVRIKLCSSDRIDYVNNLM